MMTLAGLLVCAVAYPQTQRKANVQINNKSGVPIYNVTLVHKYSDNYKDNNIWPVVGNETKSTGTKVRYNTGFGTTGKDWWLVSWTVELSGQAVMQYTTAPNNFRDIIDVAEKATIKGLPIASSVVSVASVGAGPATSLAIAGGSIIANELVNRTMNTTSTDGFKQHILRDEDANQWTEIIIYGGNRVVFKSPSGKSETVSKSQAFKFDIQGSVPAQTQSSNASPRQYSFIMDCQGYGSMTNTGTNNNISLTWIDVRGNVYRTNGYPRNNCNTDGVDMMTMPNDLMAVQIRTNGDDGFWLDRAWVTLNGAKVASWGANEGSGYCFSTDPADANGSWKDVISKRGCQPCMEFQLNTGEVETCR